MGRERGGDVRCGAAKNHGNFSFQVRASEIVMLILWHLESISDKHQRSINRRSEVNAGAEHSVFAEHQWFFVAVPN